MTCQCTTESTTNTGINPFNESIVQAVQGMTSGDTIGSVQIGIHSCSAKTFRIGVYEYINSSSCGARLSYVETDETTITVPELRSFSIPSFTVPSNGKAYVVITSSPTGVWQVQNESTPGTVYSGYDTTVKYSTIESQTTAFTFTDANEEIIRCCLCVGSAAGSGIGYPPPPIELVKF